MPASPRVTSRYATSLPWSVQRATALAAPYSMSSGWATTANARFQSSASTSSESVMGQLDAGGEESPGVVDALEFELAAILEFQA